ncbi:antitoxin [bacterium]|nr:antitoxin [bacterium]
MGLFDTLKKKFGKAASDHEDKIDGAIDKGADLIDDKTGGKHTDKIESGADKAKDVVEGLADDE